MARVLSRDWVRSLAALALLVLGIGANASVFSLAAASFEGSLPFREPERLVVIGGASVPRSHDPVRWFEQSRAFTSLARCDMGGVNLESRDATRRVQAAEVSPNFFEFLGVAPSLGRAFSAGEAGVAVLGHGFWIREFARDPHVVGRRLAISGTPATVVGVMPESFRFPPGVQFWVSRPYGDQPLVVRREAALDSQMGDRVLLARLAPGAGLSDARTEVERLQRAAEHRARVGGRSQVNVVPLSLRLLGRVRAAFFPLLIATVMIWLIVCANVGHILCTRALEREGGLVVRLVMGASRWQVAGLLLMEGLYLGVPGGALGTLLGFWLQRWLARASPLVMLDLSQGIVSLPVVLACVVLSVVTGMLCAAFASVVVARFDVASALRAGSSVIGPGRRGSLSVRWLLIVQVAGTLVLLVSAGLVMATVRALMSVPLGFEPRAVMVAGLFSTDGLTAKDALPGILQEVRGVPGVVDAALASNLPATGVVGGIQLEAYGDAPDMLVYLNQVSGSYFGVLRVPLLGGRLFEPRDAYQPVVLLSESVARQISAIPVGRILSLAGNPHQVIGVVGNVRQELASEEWPLQVYIPIQHRLHGQPATSQDLNLLLKLRGDVSGMSGIPARRVHETDPSIATASLRPLGEAVMGSIRMHRFREACLATLAVIALGVGSLGVYGAISFDVARRRRELAIRLALGASPAAVARLVVRRGLLTVGCGLALGGMVSVGVVGLIGTFLWNARDHGLLVCTAAFLVTTASAAVAMVVPAYRAGQVDPAHLLREG